MIMTVNKKKSKCIWSFVDVLKKKGGRNEESESEEWNGESGKRMEDGGVMEMEWMNSV